MWNSKHASFSKLFTSQKDIETKEHIEHPLPFFPPLLFNPHFFKKFQYIKPSL